ncbi:MAG: acyltransferase, partial [Acidimicrobiales bacterium]
MKLLPNKELDALNYRSEFRPDVQAVRALAVLLVVLYHANIPGVHGGFLGVDVFFVVSGFVITNVLLRERASSGKNSIPGFYARRIRRILPAATVVLIVTVFATYHWLSYVTGAANADDAKYVAAFVGNFHFASIGTQYFTASQPPSTLQQFWSLAVEEQFYLVWPVLFLVLTLPRLAFSSVHRLMIALTLIIGASLAWCIIETNQ